MESWKQKRETIMNDLVDVWQHRIPTISNFTGDDEVMVSCIAHASGGIIPKKLKDVMFGRPLLIEIGLQ